MPLMTLEQPHLSLEKLISRSWNGIWHGYKPRYLPSGTASS